MMMFEKNPCIVVRQEDSDKFMFYNMETEELFHLNRVGYIIYEKSLICQDYKSIVCAVCIETGDNVLQSYDEIIEFIHALVKKRVILNEKSTL